jgi:mRNA-degrading endonuclease YafQ of YafQ-DinJ toxin-antitoxin module
MSDLKYVTMTQLFWDTLEQHRGHVRYQDIRAKIAWTVERKVENRTHRTNSDYSFVSNKYLEDIWHAKLSVNPDVVLFYVMSQDTLSLAMIGSHHDYPHGGKHLHKAESLGRRLRASVERGHVASPSWNRIRWTLPLDLIGNPELEEASMDQLESIMDRLRNELVDGPIFRQVHGTALEDQDIAVIEDWFTGVDHALQAVEAAQERVRRLSKGREADRSPISLIVPGMR